MTGRKQPYTNEEIRYLKCIRCGSPATHQWITCADGLYRPICRECDIQLNRIVLRFLFPGENDNKIKQYIKQGVTR